MNITKAWAMFQTHWLTAAMAVLLLLAAPVMAKTRETGSITVFAAASLTDVMQEVGKRYEASTGKHVAFSFAGSMILARQIEASAGVDLFISADVESMDYLDGKGLIVPRTRTNVLRNQLVLIAPATSKTVLTIARGFPLAQALNGGRLAVADTETVPAGRYAKAALTALGVWDNVKGRLAQGEDVRAALAYVARGEAPLGIVYATDSRAEPKVRVVGTFPESAHEPIVYPAALTRGGKPDAAQFLAYLKSPAARMILEHAGFTVLAP
jgi:molybdate transport system substrate-binding protein